MVPALIQCIIAPQPCAPTGAGEPAGRSGQVSYTIGQVRDEKERGGWGRVLHPVKLLRSYWPSLLATLITLGVIGFSLISAGMVAPSPPEFAAGTDANSRLQFWGSIISAVIGGSVAATLLIRQLRTQERHHHQVLENQREEARRAREIEALGRLAGALANGFTDDPPHGWLQDHASHYREVEIAVTNWKMNWGISDPDGLEFDLELKASATALISVYCRFPGVDSRWEPVGNMQLALAEWLSSLGSYVHQDAEDRREHLLHHYDDISAALRGLATVILQDKKHRGEI